MALMLISKAPSGVYNYGWEVPVADGDSVSSASLAVSSGSASITQYSIQGNTVYFTLTGGTSKQVTVIAAEATTTQGEIIPETLYAPIVVTSNAFSATARDICLFALRKIAGNGTEPDAGELDDALERLNDMLAAWSGQGANVGVPLPLLESDVLYVSDAFLSAIKNNLILQIADMYDYEPSPMVGMNAARGLQQVKTALLPHDRGRSDYY